MKLITGLLFLLIISLGTTSCQKEFVISDVDSSLIPPPSTVSGSFTATIDGVKFVADKIYTMNKAELIAKIADDAGITKTQSNMAVDSFIEAVTKTLKGGGKVTLVGFGTFSVSKRSARNGRNPQTGAVISTKEALSPFVRSPS